MDFRQLETFVMIARVKSFSKAAERLFLTQPTISNHIQNLEKRLAMPLLNRSNKKVTLTKAGEIFFIHATEILNKKQQALFSLEAFKNTIDGTLEIACSSIPEQYILPPLLHSFHKIYPHVKYNLLHYDSQKVIDDIISGIIDFGFVGSKTHNKQLEYIQIMEDELVLIAPLSNHYKNINKISLTALLKEKIIMREEGSATRKIFEETLLKHSLSFENLNIIAYIENTHAIKQCVKEGLGLTVISKLAIAEELQYNTVKIIELEEVNISRHFFFVYPKLKILSPLADKFKDFILNTTRK
ncbi:LysR family transcriptional regulator [Lutibacter sp. B2]|nr:LysR family transcriptional regulator [Lutibacter sp. B2]